MLTLAIILALWLPALVIGFRAYLMGKGFAWWRRGWVGLVVVAVLAYVVWGTLDTLLKNAFGIVSGLGFHGEAALIYCALLPPISGFALFVGYQAAVIWRSYWDRDWHRLRDLWRRDN